jgi:hypothetical protein
LGTAERLVDRVESSARADLERLEMPQVNARLSRGPLTRNMILAGSADDFQRKSLVRILSGRPGVGTAAWEPRRGVPLLAEACLMSTIAFLLGLLAAYLFEVRRRARAEWRW